MKKSIRILLISTHVLLTLVFFVYSLIKQQESEENHMIAESYRQSFEECREDIEIQRELAETLRQEIDSLKSNRPKDPASGSDK